MKTRWWTQLAKLWHKPSSKVQQSWATQYTTRWSRLLPKACFQGAWVLATYIQIRYNMSPWKCLWQQLCRLKIARQEQATVRCHHKLLLQYLWLQQLLSTRPLHLSLQLCRVDPHLDSPKDGIQRWIWYASRFLYHTSQRTVQCIGFSADDLSA